METSNSSSTTYAVLGRARLLFRRLMTRCTQTGQKAAEPTTRLLRPSRTTLMEMCKSYTPTSFKACNVFHTLPMTVHACDLPLVAVIPI